MSVTLKNGRVPKIGDAVIGPDWFGGMVKGTVAAGVKAQGHPELVLKHGARGHLCPSLDLSNFLHQEDAGAGGSETQSASGAEGASAPT